MLAIASLLLMGAYLAFFGLAPRLLLPPEPPPPEPPVCINITHEGGSLFNLFFDQDMEAGETLVPEYLEYKLNGVEFFPPTTFDAFIDPINKKWVQVQSAYEYSYTEGDSFSIELLQEDIWFKSLETGLFSQSWGPIYFDAVPGEG